jgi:hypothetical protein
MIANEDITLLFLSGLSGDALSVGLIDCIDNRSGLLSRGSFANLSSSRNHRHPFVAL